MSSMNSVQDQVLNYIVHVCNGLDEIILLWNVKLCSMHRGIETSNGQDKGNVFWNRKLFLFYLQRLIILKANIIIIIIIIMPPLSSSSYLSSFSLLTFQYFLGEERFLPVRRFLFHCVRLFSSPSLLWLK